MARSITKQPTIKIIELRLLQDLGRIENLRKPIHYYGQDQVRAQSIKLHSMNLVMYLD